MTRKELYRIIDEIFKKMGARKHMIKNMYILYDDVILDIAKVDKQKASMIISEEIFKNLQTDTNVPTFRVEVVNVYDSAIVVRVS